MEAALEPDPLPFEAIRIHDEKNRGAAEHVGGRAQRARDIHHPGRGGGQKLYGTCSLFLGVDDWGSLEVKDSGGNVVAQVDLKENPQTAGEQGGHKYHTGTGGAQLPSGTYSWEVSQTNIDYNPASGNTSICNYSIDVVPTEPGAGKNPNRVPARETRATTAAERRPPRRRPGRALRRAWKAAPWETTARRGAA